MTYFAFRVFGSLGLVETDTSLLRVSVSCGATAGCLNQPQEGSVTAATLLTLTSHYHAVLAESQPGFLILYSVHIRSASVVLFEQSGLQ